MEDHPGHFGSATYRRTRSLIKDMFAEPHRVVVGPIGDEREVTVVLRAIKDKLKEEIHREILNPPTSAQM